MLFLYTSAMPGAPALSETSGTMLNVLDACLVTGFNLQPLAGIEVTAGVATATVTAGHGLLRPVRCKISGHGSLNGLYPVTGTPSATQFTFSVAVPDGSYPGGSVSVAPAGWEKLYPATDKAVYRALDTLSTQTLWRIEQQGIYTYVSGYETMSDIDTGTGQFLKYPSDVRGVKFPHCKSGDLAPRMWWIFATNKAVLIYVASFLTDVAIPAALQGMYFGDFKSLYDADLFSAAVMMYDQTATPPASGSAPFSSSREYFSIRRSISGAIGGVWGMSASIYGDQGASYAGAGSYISPETDNKLVLTPLVLVETPVSGTVGKRLPRGTVEYVWYSGFAMPDDSYYPSGSVFAGDAGTAFEGRYLYPLQIGKPYSGGLSQDNRRVFFDVTELMV